ncbi:type 2 lanthipeptide synthetase LanM [Microbacterium sp.]|uniref:type 2 lanthipeptide synthetase LanM n=1 Tax=Microbacterium sp. TaxID=51671 RepID=UPI003341F93D
MDDPVQRAVLDRFGVFGGFYEPWLRRLRDDLDARIVADAGLGDVVHRDAVVADVVDAAAETLVWIGIRTLVYELGSRTEPSFRRAAEHFASPHGREGVLGGRPVLRRLLDEAVESAADNAIEVIRRFADDREGLEDAGIPVGPVITGIDVSDGDPHRGGRRVTIVRTDAGHVVHKPRSFDVDLLVARLAEEVSADLRTPLRLPRSIGGPDHGWQEFISPRRTQSLGEYREYYRRLGALLAFFTALGGHDMHYENIIAQGPDPVPIDLETAVRLRLADLDTDPLLAAVQRESWFGVGATMILPNYRGNPRFDVDLSAAGTALEQTSAVMRGARIVGAGTLDIRIDVSPAVIVRAPHSPEGVTDPPELDSLSDPLREGYAECSAAIVGRAPALRAILGGVALESREILRPTSTYAAALEAALHPAYLGSEAEHSRLLALIGLPPALDEVLAPAVAASEQRALARHDIPYFTVDSRSGRLRDDDGDLGGVGDGAGRLVALDVLEAFVRRPSVRDQASIAGFTAAVTEDVWPSGGDRNPRPVFDIVPGGGALTAAASIVDDVLDLAVWSDDRSACTWITPLLVDDKRLGMSVIDLTSYQGGGVAMLLAAAHRASGHDGAVEALSAFLRPHLDAAPGGVEDISAYTGAASIARVLHEVIPVLDDERAVERRDAILDGVSARILGDDTLPLDVVAGLAGVLPVLAAIDRERYAAAIASGTERLLREELDPTGQGVAHGRVGVLAAIGQVSADERIARRVAGELVERLHRFGAAPLSDASAQGVPERSAWCVGAVGVAQAAAETLAAVGESPERIDAAIGEAVRALFTPELLAGADISLCHGLGGVISAWATTADVLDDAALRDRLRAEVPGMLARLAREGYRGGVRHGEATLGHMLGITGFAHALLSVESGVRPPSAAPALARVAR